MFLVILFPVHQAEAFVSQSNIDDFVLYVWGNDHESSFAGTRWRDVPDAIKAMLLPP